MQAEDGVQFGEDLRLQFTIRRSKALGEFERGFAHVVRLMSCLGGDVLLNATETRSL